MAPHLDLGASTGSTRGLGASTHRKTLALGCWLRIARGTDDFLWDAHQSSSVRLARLAIALSRNGPTDTLGVSQVRINRATKTNDQGNDMDSLPLFAYRVVAPATTTGVMLMNISRCGVDLAKRVIQVHGEIGRAHV